PNKDEGLEPFRKDGAGHAGDATADIVEAAAATQNFPYDQERPPPAQHLVGARHGAELSISRHAQNLAQLAQPLQYGFRTWRHIVLDGSLTFGSICNG